MKFKRLISIILSVSMLPAFWISGVQAEEKVQNTNSAATFEDIQNHWARRYIEFLYNAGLVSGMSETEFAPDAVIDKAQFITMLVRALGVTPDIYSISYSDVAPLDDWFAGYLGAAVNAGIIENSEFAFMPEDSVTRGDVAKMIYSAVEYEGLTAGTQSTLSYSDVPAEDEELSEAVMAISGLNIMIGKEDNLFGTDDTLTRAEAATLVKNLALASNNVDTISVSLNEATVSGASVTDDVITFDGEYSYVAIENVDFHYGINGIEFMAATSSSDLQIEVWIDSLNALEGTKLGTVVVEGLGDDTYAEQSAWISGISGQHTVYLRLLGKGNLSIRDVSFVIDEHELDLTKYSKMSLLKRSGSTITNLKYRGYVEFSEVELGKGYDTIEFTMTGTKQGGLFEIFLDDIKATLLETVDAGEDEVIISAPVINAEGTKKVTVKPLSNMEGSITGIAFKNNNKGKADVCLYAEDAVTDLELSDSNDYTKVKETEPMMDGDVIAFSDVNFSDGYNVLSLRMKDSGLMNASVSINEDCVDTGFIMGMFSDDEDSYIEVRLDSDDGPVIGKLKQNPIPVDSEYDTQSCYLYGATGIHDLYLKAIGDVSWNVCYVKLQERGWYDLPMVTLEAEDMDVHLGNVTDPLDISRWAVHTPESEANGHAMVTLNQNGGYVEFTVPEWFEGTNSRTLLTVRYSMPDCFDDKQHSVGQKGRMFVSVNGDSERLVDNFNNYEKMEYITTSNENAMGYSTAWGIAGTTHIKAEYTGHWFDDSFAVIEGDVKPGDVIRITPEINDKVTYYYIDCVDLEVIPDKKTKPDSFLSITEFGAAPNDGLDDAEALRLACDAVRDDPYTYAGVWIPEGNFDMLTYTEWSGRTTLTADLLNIRLIGSGMWHTRLLNNRDGCLQWAGCYKGYDGTVLRDFAVHGDTVARGWETNGVDLGAICFNTEGRNFVSNVWFEHWNAGVWNWDGMGVYQNMRIKNLWADGINIHCGGAETVRGTTYYKNFFRRTGDDAMAIFSKSLGGRHVVQDIEITHNTATGIPWADAIGIWGADDLWINNNLTTDVSLHSGIAIKSWGYDSPATTNTWIRNNRIERCGNLNEGNQYAGAIQIVPGYKKDWVNSIYQDTYFENNELIDNPSVFFRISSQTDADALYVDLRHNYIRNTCLGYPDDSNLFIWHTSHVKGEITFYNNVFEGFTKSIMFSRSSDVTEKCVGNAPDNWGY